jgi:hypothetical protein
MKGKYFSEFGFIPVKIDRQSPPPFEPIHFGVANEHKCVFEKKYFSRDPNMVIQPLSPPEPTL